MNEALRCDIASARSALLLMLALVAQSASAQVMEVNDDGSVSVISAPMIPDVAVPAESADRMVTLASSGAAPPHWQSAVRSIAVKYQISPALLSALVWQESRWRTDAISHAGARGLTQLMPRTARELGVDPDDPMQNLDGGARYLRLLLNQFEGDIEKALAAYNAGPGRVAAVGGVPAIAETRNYVQSILNALSQHAISQ